MVNLKLLQNNNIITMDTPGKSIIKSSAGLMFHNSMELLCIALGSCVGKSIVRFCSQNKVNVELFESISIDMIDHNYQVNIQYPKILTKDLREGLAAVILNCEVGKQLTGQVNVKFSINEITPDLTRKIKPCCGG
jgi:hypothetical protein